MGPPFPARADAQARARGVLIFHLGFVFYPSRTLDALRLSDSHCSQLGKATNYLGYSAEHGANTHRILVAADRVLAQPPATRGRRQGEEEASKAEEGQPCVCLLPAKPHDM